MVGVLAADDLKQRGQDPLAFSPSRFPLASPPARLCGMRGALHGPF